MSDAATSAVARDVRAAQPTLPSASRAPRRLREHAIAALVLAASILVFLATPLRSYQTSLYTPADLTQLSSLTRIEPEHPIANAILGDVVLQMESWLLFNREELRAGRMPLLNPYNGGGAPHFANYQSAVLSPFSVPFYVMSFKNALLVAAFLKLFCLGFFTYLFLRELELVLAAALVGAVAFMFAGYNVLLLGYPHPAAMVALPLALLFAERACRRFERGPGVKRNRAEDGGERSFWRKLTSVRAPARFPSDRDSPRRLRVLRDPAVRDVGVGPFLGIGAALVLGLFAGQPEPFYFSAVLVGLYVAVRILRMWTQSRRDSASFVAIGLFAGAFAFTALLAAGIAAIQLVPFFEYLNLSRLLEQRSHAQTPLPLLIWPLLMFPNLLGNPSTTYQVDSALPPPDFETANLVYCGGVVIFLALISILFVARNRAHAFFAAAAALWFVYAYDVAGAWQLFALLPTVDIAPINRSQGIFEFALAVCAAFAVHHLVHVRVPIRSMLFASTFFAGVVVLAVFLFGAQHLTVFAYGYLKGFPGREAIYRYSTPHMLHVCSSYLPAILALSAMLLAPQGRLRRAFTFVVLGSVFLQTGFLFRNYNPTVDERLVFPRTSAMSAIAESVGKSYLAVLGDDTILPDSNIVYGVSMPASYDGMWVGRYDQLYRAIFGEGNNWRPMRRATLQGLELFGVDYLLAPSDWTGVDAPFADALDNPRAYYDTAEILPESDVVQTFTGLSDGLQAVRLFVVVRGGPAACTLRLTLEDPRDGSTIAARDIDCRTLAVDSPRGMPIVFAFDPIADARGRRFRLRASSPDARTGTGVSLRCRSDWTHWINVALWRASTPRSLVEAPEPTARHDGLAAWRLMQGKNLLEGGLFADFSSSRGAFRALKTIGERTLYDIPGGTSRFHFVTRAMAVEDDEQAFARVQSPEFDPKSTVVLAHRDVAAPELPASASEPSSVRIVSEEPTRIRLEVVHRTPGWLVIAKPCLPGWIASIDGEERPVLRANYAFSAVRIATGESTIELAYEPQSFRRGMWISALSTVCFALFLVFLGLRARPSPYAA